MSGDGTPAPTGWLAQLIDRYEFREIVLAQGLQFHESDTEYYKNQGYDVETAFDFLSRSLGSDFQVNSDSIAEYTSTDQKVHYIIRIIQSKTDYKQALETENLHVVYGGHSRYGRGACFDTYSGRVNMEGDQWEQGTSNSNGLFRLGYPYVGIPLSDVEHHQYHFAPIAAELDPPPVRERHPHARRRLTHIHLPEEFHDYVISGFESTNDRYWGFYKRGEENILMDAGWHYTRSTPFDLGAVTLNCKVFCHLGCTSSLHYWRILRSANYKGWERPAPPNDKYAYFTTAPSHQIGSYFWIYYVLKYPHQNNYEPWWNSLQWAKRHTNMRLRMEREPFRIY